MVIKRRKGLFEDIFRIIEENIRRSLEESRRIFEGLYSTAQEEFLEALADIIDEGDKYVIEIDLPGVDKKDIIINVFDNTLEIKAEKKTGIEERRAGVIRKERRYLGFYKSIKLPEDADINKIKAKYENGVLRIEIGKKEGYRRKIEVE